MKEHFYKNIRLYTLGLLLVADIFIMHALITEESRTKLTVAFLNVGQGDSIFIEAPNGNQILVDGGPGKSVLRELGKVLPYYDRSIDVLVVTNPDSDHYAGFIDILKRYQVTEIFEPGTVSKTATYDELEKNISEKNVKKILARRGTTVDLGSGVKLLILFPDRNVSGWKTNDGSMVAKLIYGNTSVLLMGDATKKTEDVVVSEEGKKLKSDILKVGHHGSKTSTSAALLGYEKPDFAVISAGKNNKYGHPNKETTDILEKFKIPSLITFKEGTIVFKSDGETIERY